MVDVLPPLLKSLMISRSPSLWTPLKLKPPPFDVLPRVILFWKNQKPCWASPLLSKRSEPKNSTSQVAADPAGQSVPSVLSVSGASEYRAAKPWTRLSLSGRPPASFQAQLEMSIGSFEPPPVKIELFGFASVVKLTAVAPFVLFDVEQSLPVTW